MNIYLRLCLVISMLWIASAATAQVGHHRHGYNYHGRHAGIYFGWGWYPWIYGPGFPSYPMTYGYSYWPNYGPQRPQTDFGAIAYDKESDDVGISWDYQSKSAALTASKDNCGHEDCKPVVWVRGGCAAIAKGDAENVAWAYHQDKDTATRYALKGCKHSGSAHCKVRGWVCTE